MTESNTVTVTEQRRELTEREILLALLNVFRRGELLLVNELDRPHRCPQCGHEE